VTPVAFAGSWSGLVTQGTDTTYNVRVTLTAGRNSGTIRYLGAAFSCSGDLDLVSETTAELTLNQGITHGKCANGKVTLTQAATDAIGFRFSGDPVASGTLSRR
jgi:hypothetical protein